MYQLTRWQSQTHRRYTRFRRPINKVKVTLGQVQVRLSQVRLGYVELGQVRLGQVMLSQVRLGQVRLGLVRFDWVTCKLWLDLARLHQVATLFMVAKCFLRVAKVQQDCPITLDLWQFVTFQGRGNFANTQKGSLYKKV